MQKDYSIYDVLLQPRVEAELNKVREQFRGAKNLAYGMKDGTDWKNGMPADATLEQKLTHGLTTLCRGPGVKVQMLGKDLTQAHDLLLTFAAVSD